MTVLRDHGPEHLGADGELLDWHRCRGCDGRGTHPASLGPGTMVCLRCDGLGSLRAAATAELVRRSSCCRDTGEPCTHSDPHCTQLRCEACGHPGGSPPRWEVLVPTARFDAATALRVAERLLQMRWEPSADMIARRPWSACDRACRHGDPVRTSQGDLRGAPVWAWLAKAEAYGIWPTCEAPWRVVGVRRLGSVWDLRPEAVRLLCTRCYAEELR